MYVHVYLDPLGDLTGHCNGYMLLYKPARLLAALVPCHVAVAIWPVQSSCVMLASQYIPDTTCVMTYGTCCQIPLQCTCNVMDVLQLQLVIVHS